jgi:hypothetical protein
MTSAQGEKIRTWFCPVNVYTRKGMSKPAAKASVAPTKDLVRLCQDHGKPEKEYMDAINKYRLAYDLEEQSFQKGSREWTRPC